MNYRAWKYVTTINDASCPATQAGVGTHAVMAMQGGSLTCKDSLLVGWGGAVDHPGAIGCSVAMATHNASLDLEACTLRLHPDSTHLVPTPVLFAKQHAHAKATDCKLVGPWPGSLTDSGMMVAGSDIVGAGVDTHASMTLVSAHPQGLQLQPVCLLHCIR
jgi:hypothetical protein